jgi:O-antigen/teichoic acid export membrane protein
MPDAWVPPEPPVKDSERVAGAPSLADRVRRALGRRPLFRRLAGNVGWLLAERAVLLATGFLVNIAFVRHLGPTQYGLYSYALSFAALFTTLAALGMDGIVVRELTRSPEHTGSILGTALWLRIGAAVGAWGAAIAGIWWMRPDAASHTLVWVLGANGLFMALTVFELWFQSRISARGPVLARSGVALLSQAARLVLIVAGAPLVAFATLFVGGTAATAAALYWLYARGGVPSRVRFDGSRARTLLRDSWPQIVASLSVVVYMRIDQVMLGAMAGDHETGIYAVAAALSELWYFLPVAIASTVLPVIVTARDTLDGPSFDAKMQTFYDAMLALGYGVAVPVFLLAGLIIGILYGPAYAASAQVLRIHVLSFVFVCIGSARGRFLVAENLMRFSMLATAIGAAANVGLNLWLIPRWGAVGAAWATLLSYAAANYLSGFLDRRVRRQTWLLTRSLAVPLRPRALWQAIAR